MSVQPLEIIVKGNSTGATVALEKVQAELGRTAIAAQKTDSSLSKMGGGISSAGNLASKATSQIGGLVSSLVQGGLVTAVAAVGIALFELGKSLLDTTDAQKRLNEVLEGAKSAYVKAVIQVSDLRQAFQQAENGIISKETALKLYNETLGKTLGKTKDFEEAEKSFIANAGNYIKYTLLKAAANVALGKAAEQAFEIERNKQLGATKEGFFDIQNLANIASGIGGLNDASRALIRIGDASKKQNEFQQIYNSLIAQANALGIVEIRNTDDQTDAITKKTKALKEQRLVKRDFRPQNDLPKPTGPAGVIKPEILVEPTFVVSPKSEKEVLAAFEKFLLNEKLKDAIDAAITTLINDTISATADAVADALSGGKNVVPRLFDNIIKGIGSQIKELGQFMVKVGIEKLALDKAIKALGLNPALTIVAGFALQVLGGVLIAAAQKKSSNVGFATGTRNVREGGFYNVGERGQERIFLPAGSSVQPNNEVTAYGSGGITLMPSIEYSGAGFRIMLDRVDKQFGRNN